MSRERAGGTVAWRLAGALVSVALVALAVEMPRRAPATPASSSSIAPAASRAAPTPRSTEEGGRTVVRLTAAERARIGIETARLRPEPHAVEIQAFGSVIDLARVTELTNSYAAAVAALQTAKARAEVSISAARRARNLGTIAVAAAQIEIAEGAALTDQAAVTAAESQVRTLAATAQQEWGGVVGRAIVERSPIVTRLIERTDFLMQVTLPPGSTLREPPGTASAEVPPQSERVPLRYVSPATRTDQRIQGVGYFYTVAGTSGLLPGMSTLAFLTSAQKTTGIAVPESAVVHWQGGTWIYRSVGADAFVRHPLKVDAPLSADAYVIDDLGEETDIVVTGPQALLSEEIRAGVQATGAADDD